VTAVHQASFIPKLRLWGFLGQESPEYTAV